MVLSYPSNPTGMVADLDFYAAAVQLAKKLDIIILSDIAYAETLFRRQSAAIGAAGAGRDRRGGRVHVAVEDLQHAGLAHGLRRRQRAADRGAGAGQVLPRLRRLHADPGGGCRRAQRPAGMRRRNPRDLQGAPRPAGRELRPRRLGDSVAAGQHVLLGADPGGLSRDGLGRVRQAADRQGRRRGVAGPRLRRVRRGLRAHRPRRERTSHPAGGAQHQEVLERRHRRIAQRRCPPRRSRTPSRSRSERHHEVRREVIRSSAVATPDRHRRPRHCRRRAAASA